nr:hypothetical protein [uncultured bacterium]
MPFSAAALRRAQYWQSRCLLLWFWTIRVTKTVATFRLQTSHNDL